jgi:hypothetical protein
MQEEDSETVVFEFEKAAFEMTDPQDCHPDGQAGMPVLLYKLPDRAVRLDDFFQR